jgi:hypothetical protein
MIYRAAEKMFLGWRTVLHENNVWQLWKVEQNVNINEWYVDYKLWNRVSTEL